MQNPRKCTCLGWLLFILLPAMIYGENNGAEPFSIYFDVGNEIQNVFSLVKSRKARLNDFDDKLLRIQNMLDKYEKRLLKLEKNSMSAEFVDQNSQIFNNKLEQRFSSIETNLAACMRIQEDNFKKLSDESSALQEEFLLNKNDCCSSGNNIGTDHLNEVIATVANTTQSLVVKPSETTTVVSTPQASRDCAEVKMKLGSQYEDGVYELQMPGFDAFDVYCLTRCLQEDQIDCCPWTVILRNENNGFGTMSNSCLEYKIGFGNANHDYFVGLDRLHRMTNLKRQTLLVGKSFQSGEYFFYDEFGIRSERNNYDVDTLGDSWGHKFGALFFLNSKKLRNLARSQCYFWPFKTIGHYNLFKRRFSNNYFMAIRPRICQ